MPTNQISGARYPDLGSSADIARWIREAVDDISKLVKPRFANTTARDAAYAAWVQAGNTMQPGMECFTTDMGLHWSYTGSSWFLMGWSGSDQTKQPMISLHLNGLSVGITANLYTITNWTSTVNQGNGLLSVVGGAIRCNVPGKVRVQGYADSDIDHAGYSWLAVNQTPHGANGDMIPGLHHRGIRVSGFGGAGRLMQTVFSSPVPVKANDTFQLAVAQEHQGLTAIPYNCWLTVSYI